MEYSHVQYVPLFIARNASIYHMLSSITPNLSTFYTKQMRLKIIRLDCCKHTQKMPSKCTSFTRDLCHDEMPIYTTIYHTYVSRVVQSQTLLKEGQHKGWNRVDIGCLMSELLICIDAMYSENSICTDDDDVWIA
eukprot:41935_1